MKFIKLILVIGIILGSCCFATATERRLLKRRREKLDAVADAIFNLVKAEIDLKKNEHNSDKQNQNERETTEQEIDKETEQIINKVEKKLNDTSGLNKNELRQIRLHARTLTAHQTPYPKKQQF